MLILTRTTGSQIIIEGNGRTVITIYGRDRGNQVRLGFDAPENITINRKEIQDKIDKDISKKEKK